MQIRFHKILSILFLISCGQNTNQNKVEAGNTNTSDRDSVIIQTAKEAYYFGLPLVVMDITRRQATSFRKKGGSAAENTFLHIHTFPDASFKDVVRANADTYYSSAFLNLKEGAMVLTVPNTQGRYYMVPMLDAYTNVFASPGTRTTGNNGGIFLITGPNWSGQVPGEMKQLKSPTNMVWIIGRTQVNSKEDGQNFVTPLQKQFNLTPLNYWGKTYQPPSVKSDPTVPQGSPDDLVKMMPIDSFFNYLNRLMVDNPPADADKPALAKFAAIGIKPGGAFNLNSFDENVQNSLQKLPAELLDTLKSHIANPPQLINGWNPMHQKMGDYGTEYNTRATVAWGGLGANLSDDAIYPSVSIDEDGNKLNGANKYIIHFKKGLTPPTNAFWSLTMYDSEGYMVANPINRNTIGDRSNLRRNADSSIDIFIQHDAPGKEKENNWLPAPADDFNILLRVYWPKKEMIDGSWILPGVKRN